VHHWIVLMTIAEGGMSQEQRRGVDQLHAQLLGRLTAAGETTQADQLVAETGIPVPAWFNVRETTLSDVNRLGLELRRPR
jgi:hypothetical protein